MAKISFKPTTETYQKLFAASKGDDNNCSVIALAALTGRDVAEVAAILEAHGRAKNEAASYDIIEKALADLGLTPRKLEYADRRAIIDQYPGAGPGLKSITPHHAVRYAKRWAELGLRDGLIFTRGHVMALRDGVVHDHQHQSMKRVVAFWLVSLPAPVEAEAPAIDPAEGMEMGVETVTAEPVVIETIPAPLDDAATDLPSPPCGEAVEAAEARLDGMKRDELRAECKAVGVKNYANMNRADMINAILRAQFNF